MHGGKSRRGDEHPGWKTGRYARHGSRALAKLETEIQRQPWRQSPQVLLARMEALAQLRLRRVKSERRDLDPDDEGALIALSNAALAAWDRLLRRTHLVSELTRDARAFVEAVSAAVYRYVPDTQLQEAIRDEVDRILRGHGYGRLKGHEATHGEASRSDTAATLAAHSGRPGTDPGGER